VAADVERARLLRRNQTEAERVLWSRLRNRQLCAAKFRRQHPLGHYVADFCCTEGRLVIELDGGQHALSSEADQERTEALGVLGYRVIRFWNNEGLRETEAVLQRIAEALQSGDPGVNVQSSRQEK